LYFVESDLYIYMLGYGDELAVMNRDWQLCTAPSCWA